MKKKVKLVLKSKFLRHVATLASGTAIAQLLGFAFIPILSRTYSQESFGLLASYLAMVGLISSFATLKYDTALVLPAEDRSAYALLKLSNILGVIITAICCLILFLPIPYFQEYKGLQLFIAFGAILSINYNNSALWNIRFKQFKVTTFSKIIQAIAVFAFQIGLYYFFELKGLVIGNILGVFISGGYLIVFRKLDWSIYRSISKLEMKREAKRYIDFPKYFTLSNVILSLSSNLPILLFVRFISLAQLGIYGMAVKIIAQPVALISESFKSVILSYMAERKIKNEKILRWYLKMVLFLFVAALFASFIVLMLGSEIVELFLGNKWLDAGVYIKMLIPMLIGMMIATPGTAAVRVFEMQKYTLNYSIVSLVLKAATLGLLFYFQVDFAYLILIYSSINLLIIVGNNGIIIRKIFNYEKSIEQA